jgi:hypothetical protein
MKFLLAGPESEPKYIRLQQAIMHRVATGVFPLHSRLPSINELCSQTGLSRDTVLQAYKGLQEKGMVRATHGSGFYVVSTFPGKKPPLFLLFDMMNGYKEVLYKSFLNHISSWYTVDIFFHYYNTQVLQKLVNENIGHYEYYVIMPHFDHDISKYLKEIPPQKLLFLDNVVPGMKARIPAVYQDFERDITLALTEAKPFLDRYKRLFLINNTQFQFIPEGMKLGFLNFCKNHGYSHELIVALDENQVRKGDVFITVAEADLINLIKITSKKNLILGKDIGLISYDETPLKEILAGGISVISTDFVKMGQLAADLIIHSRNESIQNDYRFIQRGSL